MKAFPYIPAWFAVAAQLASAQAPLPPQDGVCSSYFRRSFVQYGFPADKARLDGITHMVYFGPEMDFNTGLMQGDLNDPDLAALRARCRANGVKILGALGGQTAAFSQLLPNPARRATAATDIARWCRESRLDGIDIDFEHPANTTDRANLGTFLTELRAALGTRPLLTAAVAKLGSTPSIPTDVVNNKLDLLHVMSYDHGGEHATLATANSEMDFFRGLGVLPSKLVLGVPFYGVHVTNRDARAYSWLLSTYDNNPDPSVNSLGGYYFNGRDLIRTKATLGMQKGGGVFTWIMDHDVTDGRSLLTAMREGASLGQATLDGFEYPIFANPNDRYSRKGVTLTPTLARSEGSFGASTVLQFDGSAWSDTRLTSPEFAPLEFPAGAAVRLDVMVPTAGPLGVLVYFQDAAGRRIRLDKYGTSGAGKYGLWYQRADFQELDAGFDYANITRWMLLFLGTNGGTAVAPYEKSIVLDNLAMFAPGAMRPARVDRDGDRDGVPDWCTTTGTVVWQDRFRHPAATLPGDVYGLTPAANFHWQWRDAAFGAGHRVLAGTLDFSGADFETFRIDSPRQQPVAVNNNSTLHLELDVHTELPTGTLIIDVLDETGNHRRMVDYNVLKSKGRKHLDLRMNTLAGTADLSRVTGWRMFIEGHGTGATPHRAELDLANVAWGGLPAATPVVVYDTDTDGDGLSDIAEDRNANGVIDAGESDPATADSDGDGSTDGVENLVGSGPMDPTTAFTARLASGSADQFTLEWKSKPGTVFDILASTDLVHWHEHATAIPAAAGATTTVAIPRQDGRVFYKVRLTF